MNSLAIIHDPRFQNHRNPNGHPETHERLVVLEQLFQKDGPWSHLPKVSFECATMEDLTKVHSQAHIVKIKSTKGKDYVQLDPDTSTSPDSFDIALLASGAGKSLVDVLQKRSYSSVFAFLRPPGHHAESNRAMGFCLFNHIAVAASYALDAYKLGKVVILDWDVHHGNGTQEIFYEDSRILYISIHQWPFYPGTGGIKEVGKKAGEGFTFNIPLPSGMGDLEYQEVFEQLISPVILQYRPELILISAGFDAYEGDPLAGQCVTKNGFARMTQIMMNLADQTCGGKLGLVLEGGYHLAGLKKCVNACLETLNGKKQGSLTGNSGKKIKDIIREIKEVQKIFWKF